MNTLTTTSFVAPSGKMFVCVDDLVPRRLLYGDGMTFYELVIAGYFGTRIELDLLFANVDNGITGRLHREDGIITSDREEYTQVDEAMDLSLISGIPALRQPHTLLELPDGQLLYLSRENAHCGAGYRLYVTPPGVVTQGFNTAPRHLPGNRVEYSTDQGVYSRTLPSDYGAYVDQWGDVDLNQLGFGQYNIHETPAGVVITAK